MTIDIMGKFDPFHRPTLARQKSGEARSCDRLFAHRSGALGAGRADQQGPSRVTIRDGKVDIAVPNVNGLSRCDPPRLTR